LKPKPDELLSSWLIRQSAGLVVKLQTFTTRHLGLHAGFWTTDVDRTKNQHLFYKLCEHINVPLAVASQTSLLAYTGRLWEQYSTGPLAFINSIGKFGRKRINFGQQYCRLCLIDDAEPYFRRAWRLSFNVSCALHGVYLRDCCPTCKGPVVFHTGDFGKVLIPEECQITVCQHCQSDFRSAPFDDEIPIPNEIKQMQSWLHDSLQNGFGSIDGMREYPALLIFSGVRKLLSTYTSGTRTSRVTSGIRESYGVLDLHSDSIQHALFETLRIGDRAWALLSGYRLLENWPKAFVKSFTDNRISSSYLNNYRRELPYWLWKEMKWHLNDEDYAPSFEEVESVKRYLSAAEVSFSQSDINLLLGTSAISSRKKTTRKRWNPRGQFNRSN